MMGLGAVLIYAGRFLYEGRKKKLEVIMDQKDKEVDEGRSIITEPMSEDDYPKGIRVISFKPFELEGDNVSLNYIKEEKRKLFRPLNAQIDNSKT